MNTIDWLLDSDPTIRWQAMRDLTDASPAEVRAERARVAHEGVGAEIVARQGADGSWRRDNAPVWLPTLFTMQLLRAAGVDPEDSVVKSAVARAEAALRWNDEPGCWDLRPADFRWAGTGMSGCKRGGFPFFLGEEEPCINGGVLAIGGYFGRPNETLARRLLSEQLADGGWNCEAPKSKRGSFHTTICVLEGLLEYERAVGLAPEIAVARRRGEDYLLERGLFRRLSTGEVANTEFLELAFPPRYHYDVLRALDHFRATGGEPDARMADAVRVVENKPQADGRWPLERSYDGLPFGESVGEASRWNTLRALRVLRWYEGRRPEPRVIEI